MCWILQLKALYYSHPDAIEPYICNDMIKACPDGTLPRAWIEEPPTSSTDQGETIDEAAKTAINSVKIEL